jgi:hypothetical protein
MNDIREYAEGYPVEIKRHDNGRIIIEAINEGGNNVTQVDLLDVINYYKSNGKIKYLSQSIKLSIFKYGKYLISFTIEFPIDIKTNEIISIIDNELKISYQDINIIIPVDEFQVAFDL